MKERLGQNFFEDPILTKIEFSWRKKASKAIFNLFCHGDFFMKKRFLRSISSCGKAQY
jgi:hypothetical protein